MIELGLLATQMVAQSPRAWGVALPEDPADNVSLIYMAVIAATSWSDAHCGATNDG